MIKKKSGRDCSCRSRSRQANLQLGFTLIELLVVVLIIGILAAFAVPYYGRAVEQSRAVQGLQIGAQLDKAMQLYLMQNGFPANEGTISMKELTDSSSVSYDLAAEDDRLCTRDFMIFSSCQRNEWNSSCEISVKRMDGLDKNGKCLPSGYPLYTLFIRRATADGLNMRYCDAYEDFAKRYYPGKEGIPTQVCRQLKDNGQVNEVRIHE